MRGVCLIVAVVVIGGIWLWQRYKPTEAKLSSYGTHNLSNTIVTIKSADGYSEEFEKQLPVQVVVERQITGSDRADYFIGQTKQPLWFNNKSYSRVVLTETLPPTPQGLVVALALVPKEYEEELKNAKMLDFNKLPVVIPNCLVEVMK